MSRIQTGLLLPLRRRGVWVAGLLGLGIPLGFAPFGWWPLTLLVLGVFWWLLDDCQPAAAGWRGLALGAGMFLSGTYWLHISLHGFGGAPLPVALLMMLGLVAIMGSYYGVMAYACVRWGPGPGPKRWLLVLPGAWVLTEWLRGWLFSGFGWLALGYGHTDSWLAGYAPVAGVYGVSAAALVVVGSLYWLIQGRPVARAIASALIVIVFGIGALLRGIEWTRPAGEPLTASLVQGSISQDIKWTAAQRQPTLDMYRRLTLEQAESELIIWPEAAIPAALHDVRDYLGALGGELREQGSELLVGVLDSGSGQAYYNAVVAVGGDEAIYHKRHLVPFGEYFPVPDFVRGWMRRMNLAYADLASGDPLQPPVLVAGQLVAVSICYEDVFGAEQLHYLPHATLQVNVSNDAWFGDSIAPHQHLQIARLRAIEAGRYQLRATNTGISAVIGPDGTIHARSPQFETHVLTAEVLPYTGLTPYAQTGNWAIVAFAGMVLLLSIAPRLLRE